MDAGGRVTHGAVTERAQRKQEQYHLKGARNAKTKTIKKL
jgi:hypothetical protein